MGQSSSSSTVIRLPFTLKLPNTAPAAKNQSSSKYITKEHQQIILKEVFTLLNHDIELYKYSPAFPEYATPILTHVRKFKQECKDVRYKNFAKSLLQLIEKNIEYVFKFRNGMKEGPKDVTTLECCKPSHVKARGQRYKDLIEKEKKEFILLTSSSSAQQEGTTDNAIKSSTDIDITSSTKKE